MDIEKDRNGKTMLSAREKVRSVWLVIFMAVATSALRIAIGAANQIILWQVYGGDRVAREHLRITRIKPKLVVSNGDVLLDRGFYHFLISCGIWLPLAIGLLFLIYYTLFPERHRQVFESRKEQSVNLIALPWALALFFLVPGLLPLWPALGVALASLIGALIWARSIPDGTSGFP